LESGKKGKDNLEYRWLRGQRKRKRERGAPVKVKAINKGRTTQRNEKKIAIPSWGEVSQQDGERNLFRKHQRPF